VVSWSITNIVMSSHRWLLQMKWVAIGKSFLVLMEDQWLLTLLRRSSLPPCPSGFWDAWRIDAIGGSLKKLDGHLFACRVGKCLLRIPFRSLRAGL
jgi:hypothetical protein